MKILACNAGSTSLKFKLYDMPKADLLAEGKIERVGSKDDSILRFVNPQKQKSCFREKQSVPDYASGINMFLDWLCGGDGAIKNITELEAVCFKTVLSKGFYEIHYLSDDVIAGMREYMDIASSHNGPYITAINQFRELLPDTKMVGVFETAFHQTIPIERLLYGIPYEWYQKYGIRKMGYHGASHSYIAGQIKQQAGGKFRLVSCHLGGSNSICAILDGKSVDTSFGLSLHTGVMHAARTGDADTGLVNFLMNRGLSQDEIIKGMTKQGGLLGISGVSEDLRYVEEAAEKGNERAQLAIDVFCSNIIHYIGAFYADLGGLDYLVFTGGIGENSPVVRRKVCGALGHFGIILDETKNCSHGEQLISAPDSKAAVMVIPANEEVQIARQTWEFMLKSHSH